MVAFNSNEWIYVSFRLQLITASPTLHLLSLKKRTPVFSGSFEAAMKVEAAVLATDMEGPTINSIKESVKKNLLLKSGRVNIDPSPDRKQKILLFKVAIQQILPTIREPLLSI